MAALALILVLATNLGFGKAYPWALLPWDLGRWVWVLASLGTLGIMLGQARVLTLGARWRRVETELERIMAHRVALVALAIGNALFAFENYTHFSRFGYHFPWLHLVLVAAAVGFVRRDRIWVSCALNLGFLVASIAHFPLAAERSELLPSLQAAWDSFAVGKSPYGSVGLAEAAGVSLSNPLSVFPFTFFGQAPAWVLGLDLRWNQVLWRMAWMGLLGMSLVRLPAGSSWRTVAHVVVLNPYTGFRHELATDFCLAAIAAYHAWPSWRWVSLPVLGWSQAWAWVLAPFQILEDIWAGPANAPSPVPTAVKFRRIVRNLGKRSISLGRELRGLALNPASWGRMRIRMSPEWPQLAWRAWGPQLARLGLGIGLVTGAVAMALAPSTDLPLFVRAILGPVSAGPADYGLALGPVAEKAGVGWILPLVQVGLTTSLFGWMVWQMGNGNLVSDGTTGKGIEHLGLLGLCLAVLFAPGFEVNFWILPGTWIMIANVTRETTAPVRSRLGALLPRKMGA
jgi:hypothetical protein